MAPLLPFGCLPGAGFLERFDLFENFREFLEFDFDNFCQDLTFSAAPVGVVAQLVERLNGIQEVRGSNPLGSTTSQSG